MTAVPQVTLPTGESVSALGQGTWQMAEVARHRGTEIKALRLGIELGLTLIDTAAMYGEGAAEELVSEAIQGHRDEVFLVSKVYPHNASRRGVAQACDRSLKRLNTDRLDLYLLHWRGSIPLQETVAGFEALRQAGADVIIALTHLSIAEDRALAQQVPGISVILGGHDHEPITWYEGGTLIHKAGYDAHYLGRIDLTMEKKVTDKGAQVTVTPSWRMIANRGVTPDPVVAAEVAQYTATLEQERTSPRAAPRRLAASPARP